MTRLNSVGYALIGLGHISQRAVLPGFLNAKSSRLVALVSGDSAKAARLADEFGVKRVYTYSTFDECLNNPDIEAVYIATPNRSHLEFAIRAAEAGKHVLCEKPLAGTVADCRKIVEACKRNHVRLMVAYRKYFEPAALELKSLLDSDALGRLKIVHTAFTFFLSPGDSWHLQSSFAGGGSLMDVGIYCVNTVRWLTGLEPFEATSYSWATDPNRFGQVDENMAFQLKFPGGLYLQGSSSFTAAKSSFLHIHGEKGWAALDPAYAYNEERRLFGKIGGKWFEKTFEVIDEFALEINHFSDCIRQDHEPLPTGLTGLRDVAVIEAIYEAAKHGNAVTVPTL